MVWFVILAESKCTGANYLKVERRYDEYRPFRQEKANLDPARNTLASGNLLSGDVLYSNWLSRRLTLLS